MELNKTHDPSARSWVASANLDGADFPLQNLPFSVFRRRASSEGFRGGVAIGDAVLDVAAVAEAGLLSGLARDAAMACNASLLNELLAMGPAAWHALRAAVFDLLSASASIELQALVRTHLVPQVMAEHAVPIRIGDYSDFYTSYYHSETCGSLLEPPRPVPPNFHHVPLGYHGRASSIMISGKPVRRPCGQYRSASEDAPRFGPTQRLDYEMELGFVVGVGNPLGTRVALDEAESHLFGVCLLNDWSSRDVQAWEAHPLGPFLAKSFATTISPWIITMEALAPFRGPWARDAKWPQPLPYLDTEAHRIGGCLDIRVEAWLETARSTKHGAGPKRLAGTSFRHQHWSAAQMVAHHTEGGCNLQPGDLIGSGTISGPGPQEAGSMIELTRNGSHPVRFEIRGEVEERGFLADGDTLILTGWCERSGSTRIGFGQCAGTVLPSLL